MKFLAPEWLIFLPLLVLAWWFFPRLGLGRPWRFVTLALLALAMVHPQLRKISAGLDLYVMVDRSSSAAEPMAAQLSEWEGILQRSKGDQDTITHIDYAEIAIVREHNAGGKYPAGRDATRTAEAIQYTLSRTKPDRASRILLLSDGYSTEPLNDIAERLIRQNVALDYRLVGSELANDYRVQEFNLPTRVALGEPFLIELLITGTPEAEVTYELHRDKQRIGKFEKLSDGTIKFEETKAQVKDGRALVRFTDVLTKGGAHLYEVMITHAKDKRTGNNSAMRWVEVAAGPRVILITSYPNDPTIEALRKQGFTVDVVTDYTRLNPGSLTGARGVIINNVPAYKLPLAFIDSLDFYVNNQGGGLLMTGGKFSFGSGGYFQTSVDPLLPVSMELREDHMKLSAAIAIVIDKSGSMGASVPGAPPGIMKINLAAEGAAKSVELLGPNDWVSVIAVDSSPEYIFRLSKISTQRDVLASKVRRLAVGGGGIFCFTGLVAAYDEIRDSTAGTRHIILFADAADAEEPGDYINFLAKLRKEQITVSVIGMGNPQDSDALFLEDVAKRGGGRMFYSANSADLPAIFSQEVVSVARSAFIEDVTPLKGTQGWLTISAGTTKWLQAVNGYNLSYLRSKATGGVVSEDEYKAPLVSFWQRGSGRAAAVLFPIAGEKSDLVRAWPGYGDFLQTITRWTVGNETPAGTRLSSRVDGTELTIEFLYAASWEDKISSNPPKLLLTEGSNQPAREHTWQRIAPGRYEAKVELSPSSVVRGSVLIEKEAVPFGPIVAGGDPEWAVEHSRITELQKTSQLSGGQQRLELPEIWKAPRDTGTFDLRPLLLWIALAAFVMDILWTRVGWSHRWPGLAGLSKAMAFSTPSSSAGSSGNTPSSRGGAGGGGGGSGGGAGRKEPAVAASPTAMAPAPSAPAPGPAPKPAPAANPPGPAKPKGGSLGLGGAKI
ncbi:hypothetical protein DB346_07415 [Verrucomicrobia bacterium LW23]|nr:hypothetical protein DB346_07415 [Verrucomicrobia bacterium LW23]